MKLIKDEIKELMTKINYTCVNKYSNAKLNEEINIYLLLCEEENTIQNEFGKSVEEILYSKYYWFTKFKNRYEVEFGEDAGISQIQYKIIEELEQTLENGVDWEEIQNIESIVMKE